MATSEVPLSSHVSIKKQMLSNLSAYTALANLTDKRAGIVEPSAGLDSAVHLKALYLGNFGTLYTLHQCPDNPHGCSYVLLQKGQIIFNYVKDKIMVKPCKQANQQAAAGCKTNEVSTPSYLQSH